MLSYTSLFYFEVVVIIVLEIEINYQILAY